MSRTRTQSGRGLERAIAYTAVVAIHVLVAWVVVRSTEHAPSPASPALQVVFIHPAKPRAPSVDRQVPPPAVRSRSTSVDKAGPVSTARQQGAGESQRVEASIVDQTAMAVVANDEWGPSNDKPTHDGLTFSRSVLASSYNPRPRPAPGRFRMKHEITPEDIVHSVSQILSFWPPGYTDDPCGGLKKTVEIFMEHRTARTDAQIAEALLQRDMYCK